MDNGQSEIWMQELENRAIDERASSTAMNESNRARVVIMEYISLMSFSAGALVYREVIMHPFMDPTSQTWERVFSYTSVAIIISSLLTSFGLIIYMHCTRNSKTGVNKYLLSKERYFVNVMLLIVLTTMSKLQIHARWMGANRQRGFLGVEE